jgi:hypothetical protein
MKRDPILKRLFLRILLILCGLAMGIILSEAAVRIFAPHWLVQRMREVNAGKPQWFGGDWNWPYELREGKFLRYTPFSELEMIHYEYDCFAHFDELGGRKTEGAAGRGGNGVIIPFIGDSVVFGIGVADNQTYLSLLAKKSKLRFFNLGVPGTSLPQQIDLIKSRHKELGQPPIYIFNVCVQNDLQDLIDYYDEHSATASGPKHINLRNVSYKPLEAINRYAYHSRIFKRLYLVQFLKAKMLYFYNYLHHNHHMMDTIFLVMDKNNVPYLSRAQRLLELELRRLKGLSIELNFKVLFILIPDRHQVYPDLLRLKVQYYGLKLQDLDAELPNRILGDSLRENSIPYVDLLDCLRHKGQGLYYVQDNHLTAEGNKAVAECLYPQLKQYIYKITHIDIEKEVNNAEK